MIGCLVWGQMQILWTRGTYQDRTMCVWPS